MLGFFNYAFPSVQVMLTFSMPKSCICEKTQTGHVPQCITQTQMWQCYVVTLAPAQHNYIWVIKVLVLSQRKSVRISSLQAKS